jgi:hypothetical protein
MQRRLFEFGDEPFYRRRRRDDRLQRHLKRLRGKPCEKGAARKRADVSMISAPQRVNARLKLDAE